MRTVEIMTRNDRPGALKGPEAGHGESRARRRLLVLLHDQALGTEVVAPAFRSRGWEVHLAHLTEAALEDVKESTYDLVIMEINQPGPASFAFCDALRRYSRAPLLLIVSQAARKDIVQGFRRGADAYVVEPVDLRELLVRAEALLRRAEGRVLRA